MIVVCSRCRRTFYIPDPPDYEEMDIVEKFKVWKEHEEMLCEDCVKDILTQMPSTLAQ